MSASEAPHPADLPPDSLSGTEREELELESLRIKVRKTCEKSDWTVRELPSCKGCPEQVQIRKGKDDYLKGKGRTMLAAYYDLLNLPGPSIGPKIIERPAAT